MLRLMTPLGRSARTVNCALKGAASCAKIREVWGSVAREIINKAHRTPIFSFMFVAPRWRMSWVQLSVTSDALVLDASEHYSGECDKLTADQGITRSFSYPIEIVPLVRDAIERDGAHVTRRADPVRLKCQRRFCGGLDLSHNLLCVTY